MFESLAVTMPVLMGFMVVIGFLITLFAFNMAKDTDKCPASSLAAKRATRILITLGVFMMSMAGTYLLCGCTRVGDFLHKDNLNLMFIALLFVIGVVVNFLVSTVRTGCPETSESGSVLLNLSSLVIVISLVFFGIRLYTIFSSKEKRAQVEPQLSEVLARPLTSRTEYVGGSPSVSGFGHYRSSF